MKEIPLTQGYVAFVDDDTFERLNAYKWFARKTGRNLWYAVRNPKWPARGAIYMHREVLEVTDKSVQVHHFDGNGLNNQRNNVKTCTTLENSRGHQTVKGVIPYRGVSRKREKFRARIRIGTIEICLGSFLNPEDAALAYDVAARQHFGEFAHLNFPADVKTNAMTLVPTDLPL